MRLPDRVVVIPGGSRGIGRATAIAFARRGARLVLAARGSQALEAAAAECRRHGAEVVTVTADLTEPADVARLVRAAIDRFGRIDVWVGAAGVFAYGSVEQLPTDVFRRVIETNLLAHVDAVRAVLPQLRSQGTGRIVLIGSLFSRLTAPYASAYVASKYALRGFARALRQELLDSPGIDVRIVLPATIDTEIYQRAANFTRLTPHPLPPVSSPDRVARAIMRASSGRGRHSVQVGTLQSAMTVLSAAAPRVYDRVISVLVQTLGLRRPPTAPTPGVLVVPHADAGARTGGWRSRRARASAAMIGAGAAFVLLRPRRRH
ncbi:SDR family NAD(P)-dependent oxidoreductase [Microbacterium sp. RD1]|uniref:SDR family NAD(P)-dependent oxidoreductase n=1 Tax=Microbacterium sp. RD1 TaxID=3457313 RepID=UPI003FA5656E